MPINIGCPICPHGTMRGDRVIGAFECDMCGARLPDASEDERTSSVCPCRKCKPEAIAS